MSLFTKMKDRMEKFKLVNQQKVLNAIKKAEKDKKEKGLTTQEYIDAKEDGTLSSLPIVNSESPGGLNSSNEVPTNKTPYIIGGAVLISLIGAYLYANRKKR